jgi:hypothetical protein
VANPGTAGVQVAIHYLGAGGSCRGQSYNHAPYRLEAGGSALFHQGPLGDSEATGPAGLPAGCQATASIEVTGGQLVAAVYLEARHGSNSAPSFAAAYDALPPAAAGQALSLPFLRNGQDGSSSELWVLNAGTAPATAVLAPVESAGPRPVACQPDCTATIAPGEAQRWWLPDLADFGDGLAGFGTVTADQPLVAVVLDVPVAGISDLSAYAGIAEAAAGPVPSPGMAPFLMKARRAGPAATPTPRPPATDTPAVPTPTSVAPTPTALVPTPTVVVPTATTVPLPTDTPAPGPSATPFVGQVAPQLPGRVPPAVLAAALANPSGVEGWQQPLDPGKPAGPYNPLRSCLTLRDIAKPWHDLFNPLIFRAGCP